MQKISSYMTINKKHYNLSSMSNIFFMGRPFPHLVIDDFLSEDFILSLRGMNSPYQDKKNGRIFNTDFENEKFITLNDNLHPHLKNLLQELSSERWISNLQELTGIRDLFTTDINFAKLSNYHEMSSSGFLGPHVDHGSLPGTENPHVLNIIIYLTEDWGSGDGGGTQLFDAKGQEVMETIEYKFNRAIFFLHTPYSFHGVERISRNSFHKRKTLYIDYYSKAHNYFNIPIDPFLKNWFNHGTYFVLPYIKYLSSIKNFKYLKSFSQYHINQMISKIRKI